jgi:glutamate racemase
MSLATKPEKQLKGNPGSVTMALVGNSPSILVFDTGLGGLTVLREVVRLRDDAHYVYVADDAFFPYGHLSEAQVISRAVPLIGELILVMPHLRDRYSVPFVGTVPAIKPACAASRTKRVSVLGTKGTVQREYTRSLIRDFAQGCEVTLVGSAELAALAETALSGGVVSDEDILAELMPCFIGTGEDASQRTDTIVLACTHYPLLLDRLNRLAPWPVDWIDPAPAIARRVTSLLPQAGGKQGGTEARMIFTSGRPHRLNEALMPFFGGRALA